MIVTVWLCIAGGMFTLLIAANRIKKQGECIDYTITFSGNKQNLFIDKNEIAHY